MGKLLFCDPLVKIRLQPAPKGVAVAEHQDERGDEGENEDQANVAHIALVALAPAAVVSLPALISHRND